MLKPQYYQMLYKRSWSRNLFRNTFRLPINEITVANFVLKVAFIDNETHFHGIKNRGGYSWSRRYPLWHMVKEAQLVCVHSSFSKRFDIVSTRKLEQYWLYPKAFTRIKELPLLLVRDRGGGVVSKKIFFDHFIFLFFIFCCCLMLWNFQFICLLYIFALFDHWPEFICKTPACLIEWYRHLSTVCICFCCIALLSAIVRFLLSLRRLTLLYPYTDDAK